MKHVIVGIFVCVTSIYLKAQSDTLYTKQYNKIVCKIIEVGEFDLRYKMEKNLDGPLYTLNKNTLLKYCLSTGFTEFFLPDELSLEQEHESILKNRTVIKFHPFSGINNQLSVAYEKVIKVGMNLDVEAGFINSNINKTAFSSSRVIDYTGAYIKPGLKFFVGQDFSIKGLKYAHPLKGRYIKLDFVLCYMNYQNIVSSARFGTYPNLITQTFTTSSNIFSYGGFVNYGRQFILGNALTIEYFVGAGFTGISYNYTNPEYAKNVKNNNYLIENYSANISNFHAFMRIPNLGLAFTGGFRIGYILPEAKKHKPKHTN